MGIEVIGEKLLSQAETRIGKLICRSLGFTAITLKTLLDEVYNEPHAIERWGIRKEEIEHESTEG
jgi:hypothetical protein